MWSQRLLHQKPIYINIPSITSTHSSLCEYEHLQPQCLQGHVKCPHAADLAAFRGLPWTTLEHPSNICAKKKTYTSSIHVYKTVSAKQINNGFWGTWNFALLISFLIRFSLHSELPDWCRALTDVLPPPTNTHTTHTHVYIHVITLMHTCTVSWHRCVTTWRAVGKYQWSKALGNHYIYYNIYIHHILILSPSPRI